MYNINKKNLKQFSFHAYIRHDVDFYLTLNQIFSLVLFFTQTSADVQKFILYLFVNILILHEYVSIHDCMKDLCLKIDYCRNKKN